MAKRGNLSTDSPPLGSCAAIVDQFLPSVQHPYCYYLTNSSLVMSTMQRPIMAQN